MRVKNYSNVDIEDWSEVIDLKAGESIEIGDELAKSFMRTYPFVREDDTEVVAEDEIEEKEKSDKATKKKK